MNLDEFEKRLSSQPLREVPGHWRGEILAAARPAREKEAWWGEWLWPCPQAWAGLAAVWVAILGLELASRSPAINSSPAAAPTLSPQQLADLREHQIALARWLGPPDVSDNPPPQPALSPRSERRPNQFRV